MARSYGAIFRVKDKSRDNLPDARGTVNITEEFIEYLKGAPRDSHGNVVCEIAAWDKVGPKAGKYLSVSLSEKRESNFKERPSQQNRQQYSSSNSGDIDDEIPF